DGNGRESLGSALVGGAENDHQENEGQHEFGHQTCFEGVTAGGIFGETIGGESAQFETRLACRDHTHTAGACHATKDPGHNVSRETLTGEAACYQKSHGDRGIEVTTRDMADGECHGQHGEAEGEGNTEEADAQIWKSGGQYSATAASKDQPESTHKF